MALSQPPIIDLNSVVAFTTFEAAPAAVTGCMRLMEVASPGAEGVAMVEGVSLSERAE